MPASYPTVQLQQPTRNERLRRALGDLGAILGEGDEDANVGTGRIGVGNPGYVEGNGVLDWANLFLGDVPVLGDALGLFSRQQTAKKAAQAQDEANRANEARYQQVLGLQQERRNTAAGQLNETGEYLRGGVDRSLGDYTNALREIGNVGQTTRRGILDNQTRALADAEASLRAMGHSGSTLAGNARNQVYGNTNTALSALGESLAGARAGAYQQRGAARAGLEGRLANFMQDRTAFESGLTRDLAGSIWDKVDMANTNQLLPMLLQARGGSSGKSSGGTLGGLGGLVGGVAKGIFGGLF